MNPIYGSMGSSQIPLQPMPAEPPPLRTLDQVESREKEAWEIYQHALETMARVPSSLLYMAEEDLEFANKLDPKKPHYLTAIGELNERRESLHRARKFYKKALAIEPSYAPAREGKNRVEMALYGCILSDGSDPTCALL